MRALILTPTRELAIQVAENVQAYSRFTALRSTVVYGGMDMNPQAEKLRGGIEIVIATPGRLLDHVAQKTVSLSQTQLLVLDEADRMLDMGFLPDLQRIISLLPAKRQNLMFSATFSPDIKKLASSFLSNPVTIEVARSNSTNENVRQLVYKVEEEDKNDATVHIIRSRSLKQVLVFSNTKVGASRLARHFENEGIKASAIHGDKTQQERLTALQAFKDGSIDVLVATDVAARGLDIAELPCVINYDLPYNAEDYVHRIGRTGRAGASGDAISLFCPKDERCLQDIEKLIKRSLPKQALEDFAPRRSSERSQRREEAESWRNRNAERSPYANNAGRGPKREKVDPWFFKPYEPSQSSTPATTQVPAARTAKPQKLAFLLGGKPPQA